MPWGPRPGETGLFAMSPRSENLDMLFDDFVLAGAFVLRVYDVAYARNFAEE